MAFFRKLVARQRRQRPGQPKSPSRSGSRTPTDPSESLAETAAEIRLHPVDEVTSATRPEELGETYVETEFDELAREQRELFSAEGESEARTSAQTVRGLAPFVHENQQAIIRQRQEAEETGVRHRRALGTLRPFSTRSPRARTWYLLVRYCLLAGDAAGVAAGAILYGELIPLAVAQAAATAMGAVVAGAMIGSDLKNSGIAHRLRHSGLELTDPTLAFLAAEDDNGHPVKLMRRLAVAVAVLIGLSVFALRTSVDGLLGGLIYLGLAIGVSLASAANSYTYTDPVADQLQNLANDHAQAEKTLTDLTLHTELIAAGEARQAARSIRREHRRRGRAAAHRLHATLNGVLRNNPGILGHGRKSLNTRTQLADNGGQEQ